MTTTGNATKGATTTNWVRLAHGSFGSRGGEPWSEKIAQANRRTSPSFTGAGVHDSVVAPSMEALRAAIESQICPWCGRGPFKALAGHVTKNHGVGRNELRDMAGIPRSASICSPEASENSRSALLARPDREEITARGAAIGQGMGAEAARGLSQERYSAANQERDAAILQAVQSGRQRKQVAEEFGVQYNTVLRILKRSGFAEDGRAARGQERKGQAPSAARAGLAKRQSERLAERTARWESLGGDHAALVRLAEELGTSHKALRTYFKSAGIPVPDGRK